MQAVQWLEQVVMRNISVRSTFSQACMTRIQPGAQKLQGWSESESLLHSIFEFCHKTPSQLQSVKICTELAGLVTRHVDALHGWATGAGEPVSLMLATK
jgi:hypothetical protein